MEKVIELVDEMDLVLEENKDSKEYMVDVLIGRSNKGDLYIGSCFPTETYHESVVFNNRCVAIMHESEDFGTYYKSIFDLGTKQLIEKTTPEKYRAYTEEYGLDGSEVTKLEVSIKEEFGSRIK